MAFPVIVSGTVSASPGASGRFIESVSVFSGPPSVNEIALVSAERGEGASVTAEGSSSSTVTRPADPAM